MPIIDLSEDQRTAIKQLFSWFKAENKTPYITLGGYAGTGKTTLVSLLRKVIRKENPTTTVAFCSYTGKGGLVLKNKLVQAQTLYKGDSVGTIHGLIYEPIIEKKGQIIGWKRKEEVKQDLIIVDEASMVDGIIWADLLSYNKPIIAVGDHGQLPPIKGEFNLMEKPMLILEHIHRQAENNPIIKLSIMARENGEIEEGNYGMNVRKVLNTDFDAREQTEELLREYNNDTFILCGYNSTRIEINGFVRDALGFELPIPQAKDRVICLRNNHKHGIYNGMIGSIEEISGDEESEWFEAQIKMDDGIIYTGKIYAPQFNSVESVNYTKDRKKIGDGDIFDFGYALTVHKAQGSEANRVILFEQRTKYMDDEMWRRWLYTGITRAVSELYIVGN